MSAAPAVVATPAEAEALEIPPLLVLEPLARLLDELELGRGPIDARPIGEGHSNVTYLLRRFGAEVVLRRPPRPPWAPSAHDVFREATIVHALEGTPAPVPRVLYSTRDPSLIGAPFYLMDRVAGDVIGPRLPERFSDPQDRRRIGEELVDALVDVHAADWRACGLEGLARRSGYLERQLRRFAALWTHNRTRDVPALDRVTAWLGDELPRSAETTLVHGDFRLGNAMFAPGRPVRLAAIFDWEMATLGDPFADLGYLVANWPAAGEAEDVMVELSAAARLPGFPTRAELVERYEQRSGRRAPSLRWYVVLAIWKSAIFLEGSFRRYSAGLSDDRFFASLHHGVPGLADRALGIAAATRWTP